MAGVTCPQIPCIPGTPIAHQRFDRLRPAVLPSPLTQMNRLAAGDVITSVDGQPPTSQTKLQHIMVADVTPGQNVTVSYTTTSGQQHTATVTLASGPPA